MLDPPKVVSVLLSRRWKRHGFRGVTGRSWTIRPWSRRSDRRHSHVVQQRLSEHVWRAWRQSDTAHAERHSGVLLYLPWCVAFIDLHVDQMHSHVQSDLDLCGSVYPSYEFLEHANAGYVSWRDPQLGSWYVETLDSILEENAVTNDLVTMLMMVSLSYTNT